ncbi:hypothetical protein B0I35DRAFT_406643 [Stachybotrys elegans]|uniref:Lipocalin-like domain-containing protein n=1 Tax=Stachybotrys elegans TaxID=80388 RepID=A0A8K0SXT0_9HYPO|nr:hypothetical protein B0I35DRAFT_406643 [Stachybotrys elegans]
MLRMGETWSTLLFSTLLAKSTASMTSTSNRAFPRITPLLTEPRAPWIQTSDFERLGGIWYDLGLIQTPKPPLDEVCNVDKLLGSPGAYVGRDLGIAGSANVKFSGGRVDELGKVALGGGVDGEGCPLLLLLNLLEPVELLLINRADTKLVEDLQLGPLVGFEEGFGKGNGVVELGDQVVDCTWVDEYGRSCVQDRFV